MRDFGHYDITLPILESLLFEHRDTLESITIGDLCYRAEDTFNATRFQVLDGLSLSRWQMTPDSHFEAKYLTLLGPSLRMFQLDLTTYDQGGESWNAFGTAVET
jgi:hypothetical protein